MKKFLKALGLAVINVITFPITVVAYIGGIIGLLAVGASFRVAYHYMSGIVIGAYKNIWHLMREEDFYGIEELIEIQCEKYLKEES